MEKKDMTNKCHECDHFDYCKQIYCIENRSEKYCDKHFKQKVKKKK
jgi:hypothetical protein